MKKGFKRVLSVVIAMAMVIGGISYVPVTTDAEEVFDDDLNEAGGDMEVWAHDYMPAYTSTDEDTGVREADLIKTANVFKNDGDNYERLYSVSTKTASPDASVEYSVYKLNDNFKDPEDGELLYRETDTYEYKGFHRENLDDVIILFPGETISIVAKESAVVDGQTLYEFTVNAAPTKESLKEGQSKYGVAVVNPGESFYYGEGEWVDWKDEISTLKETVPEMNDYELDNFSIKAYLVASSEEMYRRYNQTKTAYLYSEDNTIQMSCIEVEGVPVPYVAVDEYYNNVYENECSCEKIGNNTYEINNGKGSMIIDTVSDSIHFDEPEIFLYPTDDKTTGGEIPVMISVQYRETPAAFDIDFNKYHIDIIKKGDKVYMPLTTLSDLFSLTYTNAVYAGDKISFNTSTNPQFVNWQTNFDSLTRDEDEVQYSYNELCFTIDELYGCPPNCEFADSIETKGFDGFLQSENDETRKVRELLLSTSTIDYLMGLSILEWMINDGGHTTFISLLLGDISNTKGYKAFVDYERNNLTDPAVIIFHEWENKYIAYTNRHNAIQNYEYLLDQYTPIIDESNGSNYYRYYEYGNTGIYVYTEYDDNSAKYLKSALDIAKEHGMKNFIFDGARNGGGSASILMYMMNTITKGNYHELYVRSLLNGNKVIEEYECDMDQDGTLEGSEEDFDYDFNYAVMCSADSFSSGNLFPCLAKEEGIPIIGETSAGGTDTCMYYRNTLGGLYSLSAYKEYNYKKGGNVEAGATPDYDITIKKEDGSIDYTNFYDFGLLDQIVENAGKMRIEGLNPEYEYHGGAVEPDFDVYYGSTRLHYGKEYTASYKNNKAPGTATIEITAKGNFTGKVTASFRIKAASQSGTKKLNKAKVTGIASKLPFTGSPVTQDAVLTYDGVTLKEHEDYEATYLHNTDAGTAYMIFSGIGDYTGVLKKSFKITALDLSLLGSSLGISLNTPAPPARISGAKPEAVVKYIDHDKTYLLREGVDYKLSYKNNKNTGQTATLVITGQGNFTKKKEVTYRVGAGDLKLSYMSCPDVKFVSNKTGSSYLSQVKIYDPDGKTLRVNKDYRLRYYNERTEKDLTKSSSKGCASLNDVITVTATGLGNYAGTEITGKYKLVSSALDISKAKMNKIPNQYYTGSAIKPDVTFQGLVKGTDYEIVSYDNNVQIGTATVLVHGIGRYSGIRVVKFTIKAGNAATIWKG